MTSFTCTKLGTTQIEGLDNCIFQQVATNNIKTSHPQPGYVIIDIHCVGLNLPDLLLTVGKFSRVAEPPFTLGQEGSGVVKEIGEGVTNVKVGDRVIFGYRKGCLRTHLIEQIASACFVFPDAMTFAEASAFNIAYNTAYNALVQQGKLKKDETILILGATGGTGLAAVQMSKAIGATVIALGSTDEKNAIVKSKGFADHVINTSLHPDFSKRVKEITNGRGVDVVFDPVGGEQLKEAIRACRNPTTTGARILIIGFTAEYEADRNSRNKLSTRLILAKEMNIIGIGTGLRPARMNAVLNLARTNWLPRPIISHILPFSKSRDGLKLMLDRKLIGKVVIDLKMEDNADSVEKYSKL